jgi:DNA segregation ATPase FtsK/SpoIIIE, S-DNA-T family
VRRRSHYRRQRRWGRDLVPLVLVPDDDRSLIGLGVAAIARGVWRYRSELAPLWTLGAVVLVGAWLHARHPDWWPWLAAATTVTTVLIATLAGVPRERVARWPWLHRPAERAYTAAVVGVTGAWLTAAAAIGPRHSPMPLLAIVGALVCAVPWWGHHRRRAKVRVVRTLDAWPDIGEAAGIKGSRVLSAVVDRWGFTARLGLPRGQTAKHVIDAIPAIESGLGSKPGAVRVEPDQARADRAILRVVTIDPHAAPIPYPDASRTAHSITRPVPLGLFEDGTPAEILLLHRNVLVGGIVESGKSGVVNVILAALVASSDVVIWGIDLKGGMELGPWLRCLDRLATTPDQAVNLLADAVAALDSRAAELAARGHRLWQPTADRPALVIVVDEYAELPDAAAPCADSIARRGRAVAVNLLAATQRPTQQAMGGGAVRSQMDVRICLRVRERRDVDLILGDGMHNAGWHPQNLDAPGKFLISSREHTTPRRARAYLFTDADVASTVAANASNRPALPIAHNGPPAIAPTPQPRQAKESRPEIVLWRALCDAPPEGVSIGDLIEATGKYRTWVYERLQEHAAAGRVVRTTRGRWRGITSSGQPGGHA